MSEYRHRLSAWMENQDEETAEEVRSTVLLMGIEYTVSMLEQMGEDI
tara:strand:+ start:1541 stop:1681 length:141 start_codon:yes stop_codon:yes gene_type:complete